MPNACLARCRHRSTKLRRSISMDRVGFLDFILLIRDISRLDRYSTRQKSPSSCSLVSTTVVASVISSVVFAPVMTTFPLPIHQHLETRSTIRIKSSLISTLSPCCSNMQLLSECSCDESIGSIPSGLRGHPTIPTMTCHSRSRPFQLRLDGTNKTPPFRLGVLGGAVG